MKKNQKPFDAKITPIARRIFALWGYADDEGDIVIEPRYQQAGDFNCGLAPVQERKDGLFGYIDTDGQYVLKPHYTYATDFDSRYGLAPACRSGLSGIIDKNGQWVIKPQFEKIWCFAEYYDLLCASENDLSGYIDLQGRWVIKPRWGWTQMLSPATGLILVQEPDYGRYGFINLADHIVLQAQLCEEPIYGTGHFVVGIEIGEDKYFGVMDTCCQWIVKPQFQALKPFSIRHGVACAKYDGKWGIIGWDGKWISKPVFDEIGSFENSYGIAPGQKNGKWGFIDVKGRWVIKPQYDRTCDFDDRTGLAAARTGDKCGFIDHTGIYVIEPTFVGLSFGFETETGLACIHTFGKEHYINSQGKLVDCPKKDRSGFPMPIRLWGIKDGKGNVVVPPKYEQLYGFDERGRAEFKQDGKYGVLDLNGCVLIEPIYDSRILPSMEGQLSATCRDGRYGFVDYEGTEIIPFVFDFADDFDPDTDMAKVYIDDEWWLIDCHGKKHKRISFE